MLCLRLFGFKFSFICDDVVLMLNFIWVEFFFHNPTHAHPASLLTCMSFVHNEGFFVCVCVLQAWDFASTFIHIVKKTSPLGNVNLLPKY